jgi:hypothetical protein
MARSSLALLVFLVLGGCVIDRPDALVAADRSGHWLDRPFPSDELLVDGYADWRGLPGSTTALGTTITSGWAAQASAATQGWSHQSAVYLRFEEVFDLEDGDCGITGPDGDVPVEWRWIEDPLGDPFLAANLLIISPLVTAPLRSGQRYVGWVSDRVADPTPDYELPEGTPERSAVATAFTVQDSLGQLRSLFDAVEAGIDADPSVLQPTDWRQVASLTYRQGQTPSGRDATLAVVEFVGGGEATTWLAAREGDPERTFDLVNDWPFEVWEGYLGALRFQEPEGRPWASPGLGLVGDFGRLDEGWIEFDGAAVTSVTQVEPMRIVVQIPRSGDGPFPVVTWDHGTGGHAYNAVARVNVGDRPADVAAALSSAVVVSRDQPLYGQHYPLVDEGFGASLGFYNVGNLPAFRDNQRQATADHRLLYRFVTDVLPTLASVDPGRVGAFGHSLGSVTLHGALAAADGAGASAAFQSGSGGYLGFYALDSGLLGTGNDVVTTIAPLLGLDEDTLAEATPAELVAALVGMPEEAWPLIGRDHPTIQLFGAIMDPSDPLMFATEQAVPATILLGIGDLQVPNKTTRWLAQITPGATLVECQPQSDYDGHFCLFREDAGIDALRAWVQQGP